MKLTKLLLPVALTLFLASCQGKEARFAADYEVTHLEPKRVFKGTTLFADMSDLEWPKVVEVDFNGNIIWEYRPLESGAILDAAKLKNGNVLFTIRGSGIYEITRAGKVVWEHEDPGASHDADRLPNGNTLYPNLCSNPLTTTW